MSSCSIVRRRTTGTLRRTNDVVGFLRAHVPDRISTNVPNWLSASSPSDPGVSWSPTDFGRLDGRSGCTGCHQHSQSDAPSP
jgi:hypothetical protein